MIFSRLFPPAHSSPNPEKRIQAIAKLSPEKATERATLHELAFNDDDCDVSLAALEKLDSFPLWLKMSQTANDAKLRRRAVSRVEDVVGNPTSTEISAEEKAEYLIKQAPVELVKKVLESQQNAPLGDDLVLSLLAKIGRSDFTLQFYSRHASVGVQQQIITDAADIPFLNRLLKKTNDAALSQRINDKLSLLTEAAEKPKQLEQAYTLTLSKLQALTDRHDFNDVDARLSACRQELAALDEHLDVLNEDVRSTLIEKRERLEDKVSRHHHKLEAVWKAESAAREAEASRQAFLQQVDDAKAKVKWLYTERLCEATLQDVESVNGQVRDLENTLTHFASNADTREHRQLQQTISDLITQLDMFSAQQQIATRLLDVLKRAEALSTETSGPLPADEWQGLKKQWAESDNLVYPVSDSWRKRWGAVSRSQKQHETAARAQAEQGLKQCRRLLSLITNLVDSGRYRAAMSRFSELETAYQSLDARGQEQLRRRYSQVSEQISHLEGWQSYLAAPRKPAMLEQAQQLAASPTDDIPARAENIRQLRQQWQSLSVGQPKDEQDQAFDNALEAAFAPCREFYAEQERQRAEAAEVREALIQSLNALSSQEDDIAALSRQLEKLKQRWRDAGTVEKDKYNRLKKRWDTALAPINERVTAWFADNRSKKQAVIDEAKALAESDDLQQSAARAQELQQHWKTIGHAGKRFETRLWQAFKEVNDKLFNEVKSVRQAQQKQQSDEVERLLEQIKTISRSVHQQPEAVDAALVPLIDTMKTLDSRKQAVIQQRIDKLRRSVDSQLQENALDDRRGAIIALVEVLALWSDGSVKPQDADSWDALPKTWRLAISGNTPQPANSRSWYAHVLEIQLDIPATAALMQERRDVQLSLMAARLERGDEDSFSDSVANWLACGVLQADELQRMTVILSTVQENAVVLEGVR